MIDIEKERAYGELVREHCRLLRKKNKGDLVLPTIRPHTPEWETWRKFFASHLGFMPLAMQRAIDGIGSCEFTVPCERPEDLVSGYEPPKYLPQHMPRHEPEVVRARAVVLPDVHPYRADSVSERANVFVPPNAPQYDAMVERTQTADPRDWRYDDHRKGLWVPLGWVQTDTRSSSRPFTSYSENELRKMYPPRGGNSERAE